MSRPASSCWCCRKLSRTRRFTRLRATALRRCFLEMPKPKRAKGNPLGRPSTRSWPLPARAAFAKTHLNCAGFSSRWHRLNGPVAVAGEPRSLCPVPPKGCRLGAQAGPAFGTARVDDLAAVLRRHTCTEPVGTRPFQITRLKSPLHCSTRKLVTENIGSENRPRKKTGKNNPAARSCQLSAVENSVDKLSERR